LKSNKISHDNTLDLTLKSIDGPLNEIESVYMSWDSVEGGSCFNLFSEDEKKIVVEKGG